MRILPLLTLASLLLIMPSLSKPEIVSLGQYEINFNIPIDIDMNKSVTRGETYSGINFTDSYASFYDIKDRTFVMEISVANYSSNMSTDLSALKDTLKTILNDLGYPQSSAYDRVIDGIDGSLLVGANPLAAKKAFAWGYFINDKTCIIGVSYIPWDEGTLALLKTIHVERLNAT